MLNTVELHSRKPNLTGFTTYSLTPELKRAPQQLAFRTSYFCFLSFN